MSLRGLIIGQCQSMLTHDKASQIMTRHATLLARVAPQRWSASRPAPPSAVTRATPPPASAWCPARSAARQHPDRFDNNDCLPVALAQHRFCLACAPPRVKPCQAFVIPRQACHSMSAHASPSQPESCCVTPCQLMPAQVSPCHAVSLHVSPCQPKSGRVTLCHSMSAHVSLSSHLKPRRDLY